jgi:hypothetical protein
VSDRRRHRSRDVALVAVPVLAFAFSACGGNDTAYCVDRNDRIVENRYCDNSVTGGAGAGTFFWYYGGHAGSGRYVPGVRLSGGDRVSSTNIAENARRGGFGSSSRSGSGGVGRVSAHAGG